MCVRKSVRIGMLCTFILVASLTTISWVPAANAGFFDFLFPEYNKGPDPSATLVAPFANKDAVVGELNARGKSQSTPLEQRHRPNGIITKWVQDTVPMMLSYNAATYENEYAEKATAFNKAGATEYVAFLQAKNIVKTLKTGGYNVSGIVKGYPIVVNEGPVDGRYRWLYQIDVMVTYLDSGLTKYSNEKEGDTITQEYSITMQVGRSREANNEHGLLIETWSVK